MSVLVTGATGSIGREVLAQLLRRGADVRASTRAPSSADLPDGVPVHTVDLARPETLAAALDGVDAVFVFPSFDDPEGVARALSGAAVRRIVLLSSISTSLPDAESQFNASRFLGLERALEATGIPCTFLRAGEFAGNIRFYAPGLAEGRVAIPFPDSLHLPIDERDIAEVAVTGLLTDDLAGAKPRLTGERLMTLRDEIAAIGEALGRPIEVVELTEEEAVESFAPHAPRPLVEGMFAVWRSTLDHPPEPSPAVREITGHAPRRFEDWARDRAATFR